MRLAEILASNLDYLKINNIEKAIGLNKTALVRMIARKEIPEKHQKQIEDWWNKWVSSLKIETVEHKNPRTGKVMVVDIPTGTISEKSEIKIDNSEIENQIIEIQKEKIPFERNTFLGRKIWLAEQEQRINNLKNKIT